MTAENKTKLLYLLIKAWHRLEQNYCRLINTMAMNRQRANSYCKYNKKGWYLTNGNPLLINPKYYDADIITLQAGFILHRDEEVVAKGISVSPCIFFVYSGIKGILFG